jgi:hypothetical protein
MNAGDAEHAGQLILMAALVIVIAEDGDDGDVDVREHGEAGAHLVGRAVVGEVTGDHEGVGKVIDDRKAPDIVLVAVRLQVNVGDSGQSHA